MSPRARKYLLRDRHEVFFRPGTKNKRKRSRLHPVSRNHTKKPSLTNKQRQQWAREYYAARFAAGHDDNDDDNPSNPLLTPAKTAHKVNTSNNNCTPNNTDASPPSPMQLAHESMVPKDNGTPPPQLIQPNQRCLTSYSYTG